MSCGNSLGSSRCFPLKKCVTIELEAIVIKVNLLSSVKSVSGYC